MGIILGDNFHHDLVRPGISLYGGHYNTKMKKNYKTNYFSKRESTANKGA